MARLLVGTAVVAASVTIPDLSVGAMDAPYFRIDVRERSNVLEQPIWSPAAGATAPVYASANAAEQIAPTSLTFSGRSQPNGVDQMMPLGFLEAGSQRFDLAFAGIASPTPISFAISVGPSRPSGVNVSAGPAALRARLIDVPQISNVSGLTPRAGGQGAGGTIDTLRSTGLPSGLSSGRDASAQVQRSVAAANASVAAAFAGPLDVSDGMRSILPIAEPSDQTARAVPLPAPSTDIGASAAAQAELVTKTHLDARVNGVVTGRVDFQQLDGTIAVRLGSIVDLLRDRYSASELDRIAGASGLDAFLTLTQLQAAGVAISYDPVYDEVEFGADYDDAPQAAKVQIEQIGAPSVGSDQVMMDQIPR